MSRLKIKINEILGKYLSLLTNRNLASLQDYKKNLVSFHECFAERPINTLSDSVIERICKAYKLAVDQQIDRDLYSISDEWVPIYQKYMEQIINALQSCNKTKIRDSYDNFYRRSCSAGLVGLPTNMARFFNKNESNIDRRWFLNDSIYRINYLKSKLSNIDLERLASGTFGNPYGIYLDKYFIRNGSDYQYFYASKIKELCKKSDYEIKKVVEIGGGYGGVASYLLREDIISQYINYDLPENLALATYTLMTVFPEMDFLLYGEEGSDDASFKDRRIVMLPAHEVSNLKIRNLSVAFNSFSFSEMSYSAAKNYIDTLSKLEISYIYHVNHVRNSRTSADDLTPTGYHLKERVPANWNLGRSLTCDEFEFLFSLAE